MRVPGRKIHGYCSAQAGSQHSDRLWHMLFQEGHQVLRPLLWACTRTRPAELRVDGLSHSQRPGEALLGTSHLG